MYYCITCHQPMVIVDDPPQGETLNRRIYCQNSRCDLFTFGFYNMMRFKLELSSQKLKSASYSLYFVESHNPTTVFLVDGNVKSNQTSLVELVFLESSSKSNDITAYETKLVLLSPFIPLPSDDKNLFINSQNIYQRLKKLTPFS